MVLEEYVTKNLHVPSMRYAIANDFIKAIEAEGHKKYPDDRHMARAVTLGILEGFLLSQTISSEDLCLAMLNRIGIS